MAFANGRSGLKRVNEVLKEYGIGKVAVERAATIARNREARGGGKQIQFLPV